MPVRRKGKSYGTPDCLVAGCREIETKEYKVINRDGPAAQWFCENHAKRMIWDEYVKHVKETGRRQ